MCAKTLVLVDQPRVEVALYFLLHIIRQHQPNLGLYSARLGIEIADERLVKSRRARKQCCVF